MANLEQKAFDFAREPENLKQSSYKSKPYESENKLTKTDKKIIYSLIVGTVLAIGTGYKILDMMMDNLPDNSFPQFHFVRIKK